MTTMTDDSGTDPSDDTADSGTGATGQWRDRRMSRSDDRRIAGVAAGIAEYFDIDPTIVRLGFVLSLIFTLGSGLLAYLVLWLVLPASDGHAMVSSRGADSSVVMVVLGLAVVLVFAWTIADGARPLTGGILLPLLLIGAGVVLLRQRADGDRTSSAGGTTARPSAGDQDRPVGTALVQTDAGPMLASDPDPQPGAGGGGSPPPGAAGPLPDPPPPLPREPKPPSVITPVVISLILVVSGVLLALHLTDVLDVQLTHVTSAWLVLIAGGLLVSAFRGRATGLIPLGIVASLGLLVATVVDPIIDDGSGSRVYTVRGLAELLPEYRLGVGELRVDLSAIELLGQERTVEIELSVGELDVLLPPEPALELTIENDIGSIDFRDRSEGFGSGRDDHSGVGNDFRLVDDEGDGRLVVIVKNDIGDVQVTRVAR